MADEAKETQVETFDEKADTILDEQEKDTPSAPSTEEKPAEETSKPEDTGADQPKPEESKEKEEIPKEFHKHPAWQKRIAKEKEAIERAEKAEKALEQQPSSEKVAAFERVTSSPAFIRESMRAEGYKDEAIDTRLRELGHDIPERPGDDVGLVISKLGLDPKTINEDTRTSIGDIAKVVRIITQDSLGKELPKVVGPLQEVQEKQAQQAGADNLVQKMNVVVKEEGILDFSKDVEPLINKFITDNPKAQQEDVANYFKDINHKLILERGATGRKKTERDEKKENLRQIPKQGAAQGQLPAKSGDFDTDFDSGADALGIA